MTRFPVAAFATFATLAQPAEAMDYSAQLARKHVVITAAGQIKSDERQLYLNFLGTLPGEMLSRLGPGSIIVFDSRGGWVDGGWSLGETIQAERLDTGVVKGGQCSSACVLAWASGEHKSASSDACIGVHQGAPIGTAEEGAKLLSNAEITDTMANFLINRGVPETVLIKMKETPPTAITCLSNADLAAWDVTIKDMR